MSSSERKRANRAGLAITLVAGIGAATSAVSHDIAAWVAVGLPMSVEFDARRRKHLLHHERAETE